MIFAMSEIEKSLNDTIVKSDLTDLAADYSEIVIDSFLSDGVLKDIPIINTLIGLSKTGLAINDYLFLKKILNFLVNIKDIPKKSRENMIAQIEKSEKYQKNVGEAILLIINKLDDLEKPKLIGKIFKAFINEKICYESFLRLSQSIEKVFLPDLSSLVDFSKGKNVDYASQNNLFNAGLLLQTRTGDLRISGGNEYYIGELGNILVNILFE